MAPFLIVPFSQAIRSFIPQPTGGRRVPGTPPPLRRTARFGLLAIRPAWERSPQGGGTLTVSFMDLGVPSDNGDDSYYTFWQYADSGSNPGDQDYFNGSATQLTKYVV
jgi:hypothetical protein